MALLTVRDLRVEFDTREGIVRALNEVSFELDKGSCAIRLSVPHALCARDAPLR